MFVSIDIPQLLNLNTVERLSMKYNDDKKAHQIVAFYASAPFVLFSSPNAETTRKTWNSLMHKIINLYPTYHINVNGEIEHQSL